MIGQNGSFTTGQNGDFTSAGCPATPSATTLCVPNGLALDTAGNLYVVDAGYNRVLEFSSPASTPTLVKVFGQPNATTLNACSSADPTAICAPDGGIAFDASGRLYVDGAHAGAGIGIYNTPATESSPDVVVPARAFGIAITSKGGMFISQGQNFADGSSTIRRILAAVHQRIGSIGDFWAEFYHGHRSRDVLFLRTRARLQADSLYRRQRK